MKLFWLATLSIVLAGCASEAVIVRDRIQVAAPPESLMVCRTVALPSPDTLTNAQVATLLVQLRTENRICAASMAAVRTWVTNAQKRLEGQS